MGAKATRTDPFASERRRRTSLTRGQKIEMAKDLLFSKAIEAVAFGGVLLLATAWSTNSTTQLSVGIIQYNVKGGQGGWEEANDIRRDQIKIIAKKIKDEQRNKRTVDFVTLEQADPPLLDEALNKEGLPGWTTIGSQCGLDRLQLSYSADWELASGGTTNPLSDNYVNDICWKEGRAYNIAQFRSKNGSATVLMVVTHMPHCCVNESQTSRFMDDVKKVLGVEAGDYKKFNIIISGDLNRPNKGGDWMDFDNVFNQFGDFTASLSVKSVKTCCAYNEFSRSYDHVVTNRGTISDPEIIGDGYPVDRDFNDRHPDGKQRNEEHKAVFVVVTLPGV